MVIECLQYTHLREKSAFLDEIYFSNIEVWVLPPYIISPLLTLNKSGFQVSHADQSASDWLEDPNETTSFSRVA